MTLLVFDPFPTINKAFLLILQEERQQVLTTSSHFGRSFNESSALLSRAPPSAPDQNFKQFVCKDRPICSHCGLAGRTVEKCYKIHGFPPCY